MLHEMYDFIALVLSVALCSASVKLIDDYLDQEIDFRVGRKNWANIIGTGSIVYAALLLAFAAALHTVISLSLFLACYVVGMFNNLTQRLPSTLNSWQESLFVFCMGAWFFGIKQMLFALFFVLAIQLIDDCVDYHLDIKCGHCNFAHRFGFVECLLAAVIGIILAWQCNENYIVPALIGSGIVYAVSFRYQGASQ